MDDKTTPDIHHFQRIPLETEIHHLQSVGNYQKSIRVSKTGSAALERDITERFAYHLDILASGIELYFHGYNIDRSNGLVPVGIGYSNVFSGYCHRMKK